METPLSTSAPKPQRPPFIDYLITDLGNYLGLDGLVFDEGNQIQLSFDELELGLEYVNESVGLILQSIIGPAPEADELDLHRWLNSLNGVSFRVGAGILTLIPDTQDILWADRLLVTGLTVETLNQALDKAIRDIRTWRQALKDASEVDGFEEEFAPASAMIRI